MRSTLRALSFSHVSNQGHTPYKVSSRKDVLTPLRTLVQPTMLINFSDLPDDIIYVLGKSLKEEGTADVYTLMLLVSSCSLEFNPVWLTRKAH